MHTRPRAGDPGAAEAPVAACPALLVTAPASGQGKTLGTAALARHYARQGLRVRVFKCGPDFLDPMILQVAGGAAVHNLDLRLVGRDACARLLADAAAQSDLLLVEGVMGLYDGTPSSADLAAAFGLPLLAVIDAWAMAQTFGAVALGLRSYRDDLAWHGVLANRVAGAGHAAMLRDCLAQRTRWVGCLDACAQAGLPERHLGLVQASEIADLEQRLDAAADALRIDAALPPALRWPAPPAPTQPQRLRGRRIAVARDPAFAFLYPANVELLRELGAEVAWFSPLRDAELPRCDALWLPGGYPELHLQQLAANSGMLQSIRAHHRAGRPIVAECGGMLYLCESLRDAQGRSAELVGLLPAAATMGARLAGLGQQSVELCGGELRGHTFHHSSLRTGMAPWKRALTPGGGAGEAVYRVGALTASYLHWYFPSSAQATCSLFGG